MTEPTIVICPRCTAKIQLDPPTPNCVLFHSGKPGTRGRLWARVCQYVEKRGLDGCINSNVLHENVSSSDFYYPPKR